MFLEFRPLIIRDPRRERNPSHCQLRRVVGGSAGEVAFRTERSFSVKVRRTCSSVHLLNAEADFLDDLQVGFDRARLLATRRRQDGEQGGRFLEAETARVQFRLEQRTSISWRVSRVAAIDLAASASSATERGTVAHESPPIEGIGAVASGLSEAADGIAIVAPQSLQWPDLPACLSDTLSTRHSCISLRSSPRLTSPPWDVRLSKGMQRNHATTDCIVSPR